MTPVQLPEVPAPLAYTYQDRAADGVWEDQCGDKLPPWEHRNAVQLYTAAQLREYATEAVMAERRRLQEWPIAWADYWVGQGDSALAHDFDIFAAANEWADANLRALIDPSETNSDP